MAYTKSNNPPRRNPGRASIEETPPRNHAHEQMLRWLARVRFRKSLFGVDERDLWKKLGELNDLYDSAISAERARYDALLSAQQMSSDVTLEKYKAALTESRAKYNELVKYTKRLQSAAKGGNAQVTGNGEK